MLKQNKTRFYSKNAFVTYHSARQVCVEKLSQLNRRRSWWEAFRTLAELFPPKAYLLSLFYFPSFEEGRRHYQSKSRVACWRSDLVETRWSQSSSAKGTSSLLLSSTDREALKRVKKQKAFHMLRIAYQLLEHLYWILSSEKRDGLVSVVSEKAWFMDERS